MYATILLALVLAVVATDFPGATGPARPVTAFLATVAVTVVVFLAGLAISGYILLRRGRIEADERRFLRTVGLLGKLYRLLVVAAYVLVLFGCGWARVADQWAAVGTWAMPVLVMNLAPLVVLLLVAWTALYGADRRLRVLVVERAGAPFVGRHWTFPRYLEFMFRQYLLVILVPMVLLLSVNDAAVQVLSEAGVALADFVALALAATLVGPWVRTCWRTEPLPDGRLRRRLLDLARRARVHVADVLVWRTNLSIANGCMIGLFGPFRYILITDALLLSLSAEEVEAVFAHEAGHVKQRHVLLYLVMTVGAISLAVAAGQTLALATDAPWIGAAAIGGLMLAYLVFGFAYVSRRCEQESDLYAVRATVCPAACSPPDAGRRASRVREAVPVTAPSPDVETDPLPAPAAAPPGPAGGDTLTPGGNEATSDVNAAMSDENTATPVGNLATPAAREPAAAAPAICEHRVRVFETALRRIARLNGTPETAGGLRHFSVARRCRFLRQVLTRPSQVRRAERQVRRLKVGAVVLAALAVLAALVALGSAQALTGAGALEPDEPQDPARPEDRRTPRRTLWTRFINRNEVDAVARGAPQFYGDADAIADLHDGRLAWPRLGVSPGDDHVAVPDAGGHTIAVHAKGKGARLHAPETGHVDELRDAVGRRLG